MRKLVFIVIFLAGCASKPDNSMWDADVLDWSLGPNADKPYKK